MVGCDVISDVISAEVIDTVATNTAAGRPGGPAPEPGPHTVIWQRPQTRGRGPQPAHTRESIAEAAVRLADEHGYEAISMRRIAAEVGSGTMSLYRYVPSKDDLLDLMIDRVASEYELPDAPSGDARADLLDLARQGRALLHRHPWMVPAMTTVPSLGPNLLRHTDHVLAILKTTGLAPAEKFEAVALLSGSVRSFVEFELAQRLQEQRTGVSAQQRNQAQMAYLATVVAEGRYPNLTEAALESTAAGADLQAGQNFDAMFERFIVRSLGLAP
jgi:AcrR family transcriptional regulator